MRRRALKLLSLVLGAAISAPVGAEQTDPRAVEYGIPPLNPVGEPVVEAEPLPPPPVYGIPPISLLRSRTWRCAWGWTRSAMSRMSYLW